MKFEHTKLGAVAKLGNNVFLRLKKSIEIVQCKNIKTVTGSLIAVPSPYGVKLTSEQFNKLLQHKTVFIDILRHFDVYDSGLKNTETEEKSIPCHLGGKIYVIISIKNGKPNIHIGKWRLKTTTIPSITYGLTLSEKQFVNILSHGPYIKSIFQETCVEKQNDVPLKSQESCARDQGSDIQSVFQKSHVVDQEDVQSKIQETCVMEQGKDTQSRIQETCVMEQGEDTQIEIQETDL